MSADTMQDLLIMLGFLVVALFASIFVGNDRED